MPADCPTSPVIDAWMITLRAYGHLYRADQDGTGAWTVQLTEHDPAYLLPTQEGAGRVILALLLDLRNASVRESA